MQRLPIRIRLTVAFSLAVSVVLASTGLLVYLRLQAELDRGARSALETRAADVAALVRRADPPFPGPGASVLQGSSESSAQILAASGTVLEATPSLAGTSVLSASELRRATSRALSIDRAVLPRVEEQLRLLARPIRARGRLLVVVVGTSLEDRDDALAGLRSQLLLGLPAALLLTTLGGYLLSGAALRPVTALRRSAEGITRSGPGVRLPLPTARDEIADLAATLNEMLARIDSSAQRERQFVADASHELRSPLALLKSELELALKAQRTSAEQVDALRSAAIEVDGLAQLSDDLLLIARADQGALPVRRSPAAARDLLTAVARRYSQRADNGGRAIEVDASEDLMLEIDAPRITQALSNLVENALRHGAGAITLRATTTTLGSELVVTDQGSGMPRGFANRAFERFSRADAARTGPGAGLGLAIVDLIARSHDGTAVIRQDPGGFSVGILLPSGSGDRVGS